MAIGLRAERLFAELCNRQFLRGFVFHSPKYYDPDEREAGDVVLWVRRQVIVVEVLARHPDAGGSTRQFVKRIGKKRQQLIRDYAAFRNPNTDIELVNEQSARVPFDTADLGRISFSGIIAIDCSEHLEKPHFRSVEKSLHLPFPVAVMTTQDFIDITSEIDTIPDLAFYLADRTNFLKQVYSQQAGIFLDLNTRLERNLVAFYKLNENSFPIGEWNSQHALSYHKFYHTALRNDILARNEENSRSYLIDNLIDLLRSRSTPENSTMIHSWELASLTRRQRASIAPKIEDAFERMHAKKPSRHFAFFHQLTGCWLVFYFQYGGERTSFRDQVQTMSRYKLFVEMREHDFEYSVFGYGFRKSEIQTGSLFDDIVLSIEDADKYESIPTTEYQNALQYFGGKSVTQIKEFPS